MQTSWDDVIDDLRSWDDLELYLSGRWREVRDRASRLALTTHFDELLVDEPPSMTEEQRRMLRDLGFRLMDERCWSWTPPPPSAGELRPAPPGLPAWMRSAWPSTERFLAVDRTRRAMAVGVLREVFSCAPQNLEVCVVNDHEDDEWDDDDDDAALPGLECAALEARFGPGRRTTT